MKTRSADRHLLLAILCSMLMILPAFSQPSVGTDSRLPMDESPDLSRDKPGREDSGKAGSAGSNVKKNAVKKAGAAAAAGVATKKATSAVKDRGKSNGPDLSKGNPGLQPGD